MSEVVFDVTPVEVVVDQTVAEVVVTTGPAGPTGPAGTSGVVAASSPITYDSGTQTVGFDQSAQNTTNDGRYARLASANAFTVGGHTITNAAAAVVPLTITAHSSQSASTFIVRNSALATRFEVSQFGNTRVRTDGVSFGASLDVGTFGSGVVGAIIRGAASQSANLQEWQNSAGTVGVRVANNMFVFATGLATFNQGFVAADENSGSYVRLARETALAASPGANNAKLYFRDGTNAGTLKLVVRAGAAGAETTILDNIPQ